jgi:plastocyanin
VLRLLLAALALCATAAHAADHKVRIEGMKFVPDRLVVAPGDTVTWTNADFVPHSVTAAAAKVESGDLAANRTWTWKAGAAGQLDYICRLHPVMRASVIIRPKR